MVLARRTFARPRAHPPVRHRPVPDRPPLQLLLAPQLGPVSRQSAEDPARGPRGLRPRAPLSRSGAHVSGVWSLPRPLPLPHTLFPPPNEPPPAAGPTGRKRNSKRLTRGPGPACHWPANRERRHPGARRARLFSLLTFFHSRPPRRGGRERKI